MAIEYNMEIINERNFENIIKAGKAIIDFYGESCINCRMLEPVLTELEKDYPQIKFAKINVDTTPNLARRFNLSALPTVLFFKNGTPLPAYVGLKPKNFWKRAIEDLM